MIAQAQAPSSFRAEAATELLNRRRARLHFLDFIKWTFPRFILNWHLERLTARLEMVAQDKLSRLMVFMHPRVGKSETVSVRFPAFYLGRHPTRSVILGSYADSLACTLSRACRLVIQGPEYQRLFPRAFVKEADHEWQFAGKDDGRPNFIAAGVGAGISGHGANLFIIDDPIKNYEEASSLVIRERHWEWYRHVARTRLQPRAAVILTMARWHEDDLAGRLLRLAAEDKKADQWEVLCLPAVNENPQEMNLQGAPEYWCQVKQLPAYDALFPQMFDAEALRQLRASVGEQVWNALFQGRPVRPEGNIIKRSWIRYYIRAGDPIPVGFEGVVLPESLDEMLHVWDMAFKDKKTSSFVVGQVWGRRGAKKYLLDQRRERLDFPATKKAVIMMTVRWPNPGVILVEDAANGPAIISDLKETMPRLVPVPPEGSKEARLSSVSGDFEAGDVYLPHPSIAPWVRDYVDEICGFPESPMSDQCDATSHGLRRFHNEVKTSIGRIAVA